MFSPSLFPPPQLLEQVSRKPEEEDFTDSQEHFNRKKNRYPDRLPCEPLCVV